MTDQEIVEKVMDSSVVREDHNRTIKAFDNFVGDLMREVYHGVSDSDLEQMDSVARRELHIEALASVVGKLEHAVGWWKGVVEKHS